MGRSARQLFHTCSLVYKMVTLYTSACLSYRVETKSSYLFDEVKSTNSVSTWMGERLTIPGTVDVSCIFFSVLLFFFFFFFFFFLFCSFFSHHCNNPCACALQMPFPIICMSCTWEDNIRN